MSDLATRQAGGALVVPDFLKNERGREGFDQMDRSDVILPRLAICQSLSPQLKASKPEFIKGLADGDLFNSVSEEIYGGEIHLIPIQMSKSRILFNPLNQGGGIKCQSMNGIDGGQICPQGCAQCPNSKFAEDGTPPACNNFYNYPVVLLPAMSPAIFSMKSSAVKVAKRWNARMQLLGDYPMFAGVYKVKTVEQTSNNNTFFSPTITFSRFATEQEFKLAKGFYESFQGKNVMAEAEQELHEEKPAAGADIPDEDIPF